jgi:hypothetical protein
VGAKRGTRQESGEGGERAEKGYASFCGSKGFSATEKIADLYEEHAAIVDEAAAADQSVPIGIASH